MKTMLKQCGIFAALAAAALTASAIALVIGCSEGPGNLGYKPPPGMGSVNLNFSLNNARATVLPDTATINSFDEFILTFTAMSGGAVTIPPVTRNFANRNNSILLNQGTYSLTVVAYLTAGDATSAAAVWSSPSAGIVVSPSSSTINVTLQPYDPDDSDYNGQFAWTITNNLTTPIVGEGNSNVRLETLTNSTPTGWTDFPLDIPANLSNTGVSVPAGYYYVIISVTTGGAYKSFQYVVHIYQNMTSTLAMTLEDGDISFENMIFTPTLSYVHPTDHAPVLTIQSATGIPLTGDGSLANPYILSLTGNSLTDKIDIIVDNADDFDTLNLRFSGGSNFSFSMLPPDDTFTIEAGWGPYVAVVMVDRGSWGHVVVGITADGVPYAAEPFYVAMDVDP
ncbi:MAG: hypothetical protein LBH20_04980 [Treponema sp.]|jgi:hypothetical protein|nr:hypothetical protein [Treponema sp.]